MDDAKAQSIRVDDSLAMDRSALVAVSVFVDVGQDFVAREHDLVAVVIREPGGLGPLLEKGARFGHALRSKIERKEEARGWGTSRPEEQGGGVISIGTGGCEFTPALFEDDQRVLVLRRALGQAPGENGVAELI